MHVIRSEGGLTRSASNPMLLDGIVAPYGALTISAEPMGKSGRPMREFLTRGALRPEKQVLLRADHDRSSASIVGEMIRHEDRAEGLWAEFELFDTQAGRDASILVGRQAVTGLSAEMTVATARYSEVTLRGKGTVRKIERVALAGVGLVEHPAYAEARVSFRHASLEMIDTGGTLPKVEQWRQRLQALRGEESP